MSFWNRQTMKKMIHSPLGPVADERSRIIILGSMPSEISIARAEYYANPRNQFWNIVYDVFEAGLPPQLYDKRISFLLERGIALWDVARACVRERSSDSSIFDVVPNDITELLKQYKNITYILFNGKKATSLFMPLGPDVSKGITLRTLPSSSPAHAAMPMEIKAKVWRAEIRSALAKGAESSQ